jgi:hypothetical protein
MSSEAGQHSKAARTGEHLDVLVNVSITLDTCSHVIPGPGDVAAGALDDLLG